MIIMLNQISKNYIIEKEHKNAFLQSNKKNYIYKFYIQLTLEYFKLTFIIILFCKFYLL